jgi:transcriptional regulator with XRE-family HTH domain
MPRRDVADPLAEKVGARIRDLREARGLSITALADKSGVSKGWLSSIERGLQLIKLPTIASLAKGLGVTAADIMTFPADSELDAIAECLRCLPEAEQQELIRQIQEASTASKTA